MKSPVHLPGPKTCLKLNFLGDENKVNMMDCEARLTLLVLVTQKASPSVNQSGVKKLIYMQVEAYVCMHVSRQVT